MPPAGFEPAIPASEWLQTHALDRAATGMGSDFCFDKKQELLFMYCLVCMLLICKTEWRFSFQGSKF
jgi:hypothetical protein